jgi:phenylpyruvate tautomerase PptA (4-oxalocrotonate tautomerase family)
MPLSRISIPAALAPQKARALADAVHEGLVETCNVPPGDRFQLISVYEPEMMLIDPTFPDVRRTVEASIVEILFLEGRTIDQKRDLFRRIAARAMQAGFAGDDIMVTLTENAPTDWSVGYGRCYGDQHAPQAIDA